MALITVTQGGVNIDDGVYPVILVEIKGPKTVMAQRGPKAGQEIELLDWQFAVDEPRSAFDQTVIEASTSTASGPKSKMYGYLTALFGGKAPAVGASFEASDLYGRRALATIRKDDAGWPRVENLGAMPASMLGQRVAAATGAPLNLTPAQRPAAREAAAAPARAAVSGGPAAAAATPADELPF